MELFDPAHWKQIFKCSRTTKLILPLPILPRSSASLVPGEGLLLLKIPCLSPSAYSPLSGPEDPRKRWGKQTVVGRVWGDSGSWWRCWVGTWAWGLWLIHRRSPPWVIEALPKVQCGKGHTVDFCSLCLCKIKRATYPSKEIYLFLGAHNKRPYRGW